MRMTRRTCVQSLAAGCLTPCMLQAGESLFNGRDLSGWKRHANGLFSVENGEIVARFDPAHPGAGYLFTEREFTDFILELEFWVGKGGNSGIFIRQPLRTFGSTGDERPGQRPTDGVEVQIDYNDPKNYTGSIYNFQKPLKVVGSEESWNRYKIECNGPRVRAWVNGEMVNDYGSLRSLKGAIGLQMHGGKPHDHVVKFRNLKLV